MKMQRIAKFSKVSWEQFVKDWREEYVGINDEIIRKIYCGIDVPKRATKGSAGYLHYHLARRLKYLRVFVVR